MRLEPVLGWPVTVVVLTLMAVALWFSARWALKPTADPGARSGWWRRVALALATLLVLAGPSVPVTQSDAVSSIEIYLVVDRTGSMGAEDWGDGGTRLDGVRQDVHAIREAYPDARYSIIALDSVAVRELPLTSDVDAADAWLRSLSQEVTGRSSGSSLERALPLLAQTLSASAEKSPQDARVVYLLSDGEATDEGAAAEEAAIAGVSWDQLSDVVDGGAVLGYGTPEGGRMRDVTGTTGADAPYIQDPSTGKDAVSVPDTEELQSVAEALGVEYLQRTGGPGDAVTSTFTNLGVEAVLGDGRESKGYRRYMTWPLGVVAAGLLIWEAAALALTDRSLRGLTQGADTVQGGTR